jgi:hypothetical protein
MLHCNREGPPGQAGDTITAQKASYFPHSTGLLMDSIVTFVSRAVQIVLVATLALAGFIFTLGLLAAVAVVGTAMLVVGLLTGRRPQIRGWSRFDPRAVWKHAGRPRHGGFGEARGRAAPRDADVIDVEVREVAGPPRTPPG